jgi:prepilin-type N-terminal cleavage/methylation domain-containing protein
MEAPRVNTPLATTHTGFTLIELAVVLVIISILVIMATMNFNNNVAKAELGALKALGSQCRSAAAAQLSETNDAALVDFTDFVTMPGVASTTQTLLSLPNQCATGTSVAPTVVTCAMTEKMGTYTYNPTSGFVTIAVS